MIDYFRIRILPLKSVQLLVRTGMKWQQDNCSGMGVALSYYALFSLFPILLVILSVLGSLLGPDTIAVQQIQRIVQQFLPPEIHGLIDSTVRGLNQTSTGAGIIGFGLLLYSASTVFGVLNYSVDQIWQVNSSEDNPNSLKRTVLIYLFNKLTAFLLVLGTALLLLVSMVSNLAINTVLELVGSIETVMPGLHLEDWRLADGLQIGSSFLLLALVNLLLLKVLPSTRVAWRDIWPGAMLTAVLLVGLQRLVSTSVISIGSKYLSYGVVGSVMILLLWIYLTCQIFFVGCEFSYTYAYLYGSRRHQGAG